jgi:hypothetical protein
MVTEGKQSRFFRRGMDREQDYEDITQTLRKRDTKSWMGKHYDGDGSDFEHSHFFVFFSHPLGKWRARPPIKSPGTRNPEARGRGRFPPDRLLRFHCVCIFYVLFIM